MNLGPQVEVILLGEEAWLADAGQVEAKARDELGMQDPEESYILVVRP